MSALQASAQNQLRQYIEQIERLEEEKKALAGDIRDKYLEAKAFGFQIGLIRRWQWASSTSIATALDDSRMLIESNDYEGFRRIIDVSGDGPDNGGADLEAARKRALAAEITVNGLPIMADDSALDRYYEDKVIAGATAFIEPARDFEDYVRAIREKLLRELRPLGS